MPSSVYQGRRSRGLMTRKAKTKKQKNKLLESAESRRRGICRNHEVPCPLPTFRFGQCQDALKMRKRPTKPGWRLRDSPGLSGQALGGVEWGEPWAGLGGPWAGFGREGRGELVLRGCHLVLGLKASLPLPNFAQSYFFPSFLWSPGEAPSSHSVGV